MSAGQADISITITDLRRQFHRVLRAVERGETFTIMRRGRPVARLVLHLAPERAMAAYDVAVLTT